MAVAPPPGLTEEDFERIESAVLETERGRWFLLEYARRIRAAETSALAATLSRIEQSLSWGEGARGAQTASRLLAETEAVRRKLHDLAWRLGEIGAAEASGLIHAEAAALDSLSALEPPLAISASPADSSHQENAAIHGEGALSLRLNSIGAMEQAEPVPLVHVLPQAPLSLEGGPDPRLSAFAALEGLSVREKLALFS